MPDREDLYKLWSRYGSSFESDSREGYELADAILKSEWLAAHDAEVRDAALKEAATRARDASRLSDFGADAQTAEERRILSERWEREHPGVDSSASRLRPREEGKDQ